MADLLSLPSKEDQAWKQFKEDTLQTLLKGGVPIGPRLVDDAWEYVRRVFDLFNKPALPQLPAMDAAGQAAVLETISLVKMMGLATAFFIAVEFYCANHVPGLMSEPAAKPDAPPRFSVVDGGTTSDDDGPSAA